MIRNAAIIVTLAAAPLVHAEGFENVAALFGGGTWAQANLSNPMNGTAPWGQGDPSQFEAASGPADSYIAANYAATGDGSGTATDAGTISAWLFAPTQTFDNGDHVLFMTRTAAGSTFADRLQVRFSGSGASMNVGADESSVGDFTTLLAEINPNLVGTGYPDGWTAYDVTLSGLPGPTSGRIGFRYYVTDAGAMGTNSNLVALDSYHVRPVPEPTSLAALGLGALALARRRRVR